MVDKSKALSIVKNIYLYLVALVGIIVLVVATIMLLNVVIKFYILGLDTPRYAQAPEAVCEDPYQRTYRAQPKPVVPIADQEAPEELTPEQFEECVAEETQKQKKEAARDVKEDIAWSISAIIVALPLWLYHWKIIRRENK